MIICGLFGNVSAVIKLGGHTRRRNIGNVNTKPFGGPPVLPTDRGGYQDDPNGYWSYVWRWADAPEDALAGSDPNTGSITYTPKKNPVSGLVVTGRITITDHLWSRKTEFVEIF